MVGAIVSLSMIFCMYVLVPSFLPKAKLTRGITWVVNYSLYVYNNGSKNVRIDGIFDIVLIPPNTSFQMVFNINVKVNGKSVNISVIKSKGGNVLSLLKLNLPVTKLAPKSTVNICISYTVELFNDKRLASFSDMPDYLSVNDSGTIPQCSILLRDDYYRYTRETPLWNTSSTEVQWAADQVLSGVKNKSNVLEIVYAAVTWVKSHVAYPSCLSLPKYPEEIIRKIRRNETATGDCDDQANLLIAILRTIGIPAYLMAGGWYVDREIRLWILGNSNTTYGFYADYKNFAGHGWAVVFVPPYGWLPIDLTFGSGNTPSSCYYNARWLKEDPIMLWFCACTWDYVGEFRNYLSYIKNNSLRVIEKEVWTERPHVGIITDNYYWNYLFFWVIVASVAIAIMIIVLLFAIKRVRGRPRKLLQLIPHVCPIYVYYYRKKFPVHVGLYAGAVMIERRRVDERGRVVLPFRGVHEVFICPLGGVFRGGHK